MAGKFQPPPPQDQQVLEENGDLTQAYRRWFELIPPALSSPASSGSVPAKANSPGIAGQIATDGAYFYVCLGPNSWKRAPLSAF